MPKLRFTFGNLVLFGGLLALSLLFWLESHMGYSAKSALLLQSEPGVEVSELAKTAATFAKTGAYAERTLSSSRLQEGVLGQKQADEQKKILEAIEVRGGKHGGLVTVTAFDTESDVAKIASFEATDTLIRMSKLYLGEDRKLKVNVIDESIVEKKLLKPYWYVLQSLITAAILFLFIFLLKPLFLRVGRLVEDTQQREMLSVEEAAPRKKWFNLPDFSKKKKSGEPTKQDPRFVPEKIDPHFLSLEKEPPVKEVIEEQPKASEVLKKKEFGAPSSGLQSVSVAMEDLPFTFETEDEAPHALDEVSAPEEERVENVSEETEDPKKEPTVLEYKKRLNELLSQK